jgi:hypothetical protein
MKHAWLPLVLLIAATFGIQTPTFAQEDGAQKAAEKAAEEIISALGQQNYKLVWSELTSEWLKKQQTEATFLANMEKDRSPLGILQTSSLVSREGPARDPSTGYQGDIYAFTFRDKYPIAEINDRILVFADSDGQYRLGGLFPAPVPK